MFFIKLMLIILLNETFAYVTQSDIEIVILPAWKPTGKKKISLTLKVFGKQIELDLYRDDQTTSSAIKNWEHDAKNETEPLQLNASNFCYYHHNDDISSAVINFCQDTGWKGFVLLEDDTMEIRPLQDDFASLTLTDNSCIKKKTNISFGKLHSIRRSVQSFANSSFYDMNLNNFKQKRQVEDTQKKLTIELGIFFDKAAYRMFMPILDEDKHKLRNMILAYVNNIQAVFHHPSLGVPIDISLVYLEIMDSQPTEIPISNNSFELFPSFCKYAYSRNLLDDNDRHHWDIAIYLTGLNIFWLDTNTLKRDYDLLGLSKHNVSCGNQSCMIIEFGVDGELSSGFASSLITAHEIGHVLGMFHDEACETFDHIMALRQYNRGQVTWSKCSRNITRKLWDEKPCLRDRTIPESVTEYAYNHTRYNNLPGREWNAKAQCEIYFRNKDANVVSLLDICQTLQCETSNQNNFTGPALEGTHCAYGKECRGGECVPMCKPSYVSKYDEIDNWSEWKADSCKSGCLNKSKGAIVKRRSCAHGSNKSAHCKGPYYDVALCDDSLICANHRSTVFHYTQEKCVDFMMLAEQKQVSSEFQILRQPGIQIPHNVNKPWIACTIFCTKYRYLETPEGDVKRHDYYASGLEIVNLGLDPYFPDGTWCHQQNGQNYYCRQHYCLPENYSSNSQEE